MRRLLAFHAILAAGALSACVTIMPQCHEPNAAVCATTNAGDHGSR